MVCHMLFSLWRKKENKITLELPSATLLVVNTSGKYNGEYNVLWYGWINYDHFLGSYFCWWRLFCIHIHEK